jgi:hypothetical protein
MVELLVILAIIAVLICLLVPAVLMSRETAARTQSANNLHNFGFSCNTCAEQRQGSLPPAYGTWAAGGSVTNKSFFAYLMPHIEGRQGPPKPNEFLMIYCSYLDNSHDRRSNKCSYAVNSSLFVPNVGVRYPDCFEKRGRTNEILFLERFAVTGYVTHTWSSVATSGSPQVAAVDGATAGSCQFGFENTEIISRLADRTAHAFTPKGFLVCVGDASTRLMNMSANNPYSYQSGGIDVSRTTFNWGCDPSANLDTPMDGSW